MEPRHRRGIPAVARVAIAATVVILVASLVVILARRGSDPVAEVAYLPRPAGSVTYHQHIAPILRDQCIACHQEGQPGPFRLETYAEVKKRADQLVTVTQSGFMPPWLPDAGVGEFVGARRLSGEQLGLLRQWAEDGAPEGPTGGVVLSAASPGGWQLGEPDLVVEMAEPFPLPADGPDVYRNFVIPLALPDRRFVRAVEFQPRTKVIHHAFMMLDPTRQSRRLDARDAEPGFPGTAPPSSAESPGGYFLSWQPGRRPVESPAGLAWALKPGQDLLLQMHMQPRGAVEAVRPAVGFYFTDEAPTNTPIKISLSSYDIDIPAGAQEYEVRDRFVLPADVHLLSLLPHAHFLARTVEGHAVLPDGRTEPLLRISHWDFNWQSDYRLTRPLFLPKGTELVMRLTYDNSTNNVRNPSQPPVRVKYGPQTRDEMGELWVQLLTRTPADGRALQTAYQQRLVRDALQYHALVIAREPANAHAHVQLGKACYALGETNRAQSLMQRAVELDPNEEEGHYNLGVLLMDSGQNRAAAAEFRKTLLLNPENVGALNNFGLILLYDRQFENSEKMFRKALRINPDATFAKANLELLDRTRKTQPR